MLGGRHGSDLLSLWLWCRPGAAAPIQPLARERLHAAGVSLKTKTNQIKEAQVVKEPPGGLHLLPLGL